MATGKIKIRFTDEIYGTRLEVAKILGTNNIDPFWAEIVEYRKSFSFDLKLVDVTNMPLFFCLGSYTRNKIKALDNVKGSYSDLINALAKDSMDYRSMTNKLYGSCLESIAKCNKLSLDQVSIENILSGHNVDYSFNAIQRYLSALRIIKDNNYKLVSEEILADLYAAVCGVPQITEFYRQTELVNSKQNVLINREYYSAPVSKIEQQMEQLLSLLQRRDLPLFAKVAINLYMFNAIKPFAKYNTEIALLTSKILLIEELGEAAIYLPIEAVLAKDDIGLASIIRESQKTRDLTYIVNEYLTLLNEVFETACNAFVKSALDSLEEDHEQDVKEVQEEAFEKVEPVEEKKVEQKFVHHDQTNVQLNPVSPVKTVEQTLPERELQRLTQELLETDPSLKKGQAHFYIRHREPGHFYTIEQYRKCEGCVYETARTSMDTLAMKGYYRREKVNNKKFVYTPVFK